MDYGKLAVSKISNAPSISDSANKLDRALAQHIHVEPNTTPVIAAPGYHVRDMSVPIKVGNTWYIYHSHFLGSNYMTTSELWVSSAPDINGFPDVRNWTVIGPVIQKGPAGSHYESALFNGAAMIAPDGYIHLFTSGANATDMRQIVHAKSLNPTSGFVVDPSPTVASFQQPWIGKQIDDVRIVLADDGLYRLYHRGVGTNPPSLGYWTSPSLDGPWTPYPGNPIHSPATYEESWGVCQINGKWHFLADTLYAGSPNIKHYISDDGAHLSPAPLTSWVVDKSEFVDPATNAIGTACTGRVGTPTPFVHNGILRGIFHAMTQTGEFTNDATIGYMRAYMPNPPAKVITRSFGITNLTSTTYTQWAGLDPTLTIDADHVQVTLTANVEVRASSGGALKLRFTVDGNTIPFPIEWTLVPSQASNEMLSITQAVTLSKGTHTIRLEAASPGGFLMAFTKRQLRITFP